MCLIAIRPAIFFQKFTLTKNADLSWLLCCKAFTSQLDWWPYTWLTSLVVMVTQMRLYRRRRSRASPVLTAIGLAYGKPVYLTPNRIDVINRSLKNLSRVIMSTTSTAVQNLVIIDAVVFIIWTFQYVARLAGKCLFTPPKLVFLGNLIP